MLVFIMAGCSGSSATGHMLRMLVNCTKGWKDYDARQHGEDSHTGEAFKGEKNPWFQKLKERQWLEHHAAVEADIRGVDR